MTTAKTDPDGSRIACSTSIMKQLSTLKNHCAKNKNLDTENPIIILIETFLLNISTTNTFHFDEPSNFIHHKKYEKKSIRPDSYILLFKWDFTVIMNTLAFSQSTENFNFGTLFQVHIASG